MCSGSHQLESCNVQECSTRYTQREDASESGKLDLQNTGSYQLDM